MSQAGELNSAAGPVPPIVPTSFVTQNGTAVPSANILIVHGVSSSINNANGIIANGGVVGTGTSNEVDIALTNQLRGSGTTVGATSANLFTFALGATPATYFIQIGVVAFEAATPSSAGYETYTTVRTNGTTAVIIGDTDTITHEDPSLVMTLAQITVSGNNVIFQVTGVAGLTIDWVAVGTYIEAN